MGVLVLVLVLGCRSRLGLRLSRLLARPDRPFRLVRLVRRGRRLGRGFQLASGQAWLLRYAGGYR